MSCRKCLAYRKCAARISLVSDNSKNKLENLVEYVIKISSLLLFQRAPITIGITVILMLHIFQFSGKIRVFVNRLLLWTPTHGRAKAGRPARTYIQQLCEDTGCSPEDLPEAMNDREKWRERVRDIRAGGTTWWWWWYSMKSAWQQVSSNFLDSKYSHWF